MALIELKFQLPPDLREITAEMEDNMKPPEIIDELLNAEVIRPNAQGYLLAIKGGDFLNNDTELGMLNLQPGSIVRVVAATDAGLIRSPSSANG